MAIELARYPPKIYTTMNPAEMRLMRKSLRITF